MIKDGLGTSPAEPGEDFNCGVGLNAPRHFFYDANFWDCLAHLSVESPPGRRLVAPCGMAPYLRTFLAFVAPFDRFAPLHRGQGGCREETLTEPDRTRNKHTMRVSLKDILEAFEFVSADSTGEQSGLSLPTIRQGLLVCRVLG